MSRAIVMLAEKAGFRFDECYKCPYHDDQHQKRTVKELAESVTAGCPVCFLHHCAVIQGIPDITPDDNVLREHANPVASSTVETPNARIQWREATFFVQSCKALRKSTIRDYFCPPATGVVFYVFVSRRLAAYQAPIESCRFFVSTSKPPDICSIPVEGTESAASLESALAWLRHCTSDHPRCGPGENQKLPSRVLNIKKDPVFLYETQNGLARYACLSHC